MIKISLRAARVNANLTQDDVAAYMKKNKQTIVNWENGKTLIDMANLQILCKLYGIDENYIFLPNRLA